MRYRKEISLGDGRKIKLESLTGKENIRELRDYINSFYEEGTYLMFDRPLTLKEEIGRFLFPLHNRKIFASF